MFNLFNNYPNNRECFENKNTNSNSCEYKQTITKCSTENFETLQKARRDLVGEFQAIIEYDEHIHNTDDKLAKQTWENIKQEELTHAGELMALINYLDPMQKQFVEKGINEFFTRIKN